MSDCKLLVGLFLVLHFFAKKIFLNSVYYSLAIITVSISAYTAFLPTTCVVYRYVLPHQPSTSSQKTWQIIWTTGTHWVWFCWYLTVSKLKVYHLCKRKELSRWRIDLPVLAGLNTDCLMEWPLRRLVTTHCLLDWGQSTFHQQPPPPQVWGHMYTTCICMQQGY